MIRLLYITTSFNDKGPLQQLFNIVSSLDRDKFEPVVLSLTAPYDGDKSELFQKLNVEIHHRPWKWTYILFPFTSFKGLLKELNPSLIHTSGFLPDVLSAFSIPKHPWILTARNDPFVDYPSKFGYFAGYIMAVIHLIAIQICPFPIACSSSLSKSFQKYRIKTRTIRNGVNYEHFKYKEKQTQKKIKKIRFLTAGSLIRRKNIELMVELFSSKKLRDTTEFIILGDGPLHERCRSIAAENIFFKGHVGDVNKYLTSSDCYISLSKSEGMPNSVMEALISGLPCILSDIEPHKEIELDMPKATILLKKDSTLLELENSIKNFILQRSNFDNIRIASRAKSIFDYKTNSSKYQKIYLKEINKI